MDPVEITHLDDRWQHLVGSFLAKVAHQIFVGDRNVVQAAYVGTSKAGCIIGIQHIGCTQLYCGMYARQSIRDVSV